MGAFYSYHDYVDQIFSPRLWIDSGFDIKMVDSSRSISYQCQAESQCYPCSKFELAEKTGLKDCGNRMAAVRFCLQMEAGYIGLASDRYPGAVDNNGQVLI